MRTTITLEPDVAEKIRKASRLGKRSKTAIINEALRRGLASDRESSQVQAYRVETFNSPFRTGIDMGKLNQLVDELEVEAELEAKLRK